MTTTRVSNVLKTTQKPINRPMDTHIVVYSHFYRFANAMLLRNIKEWTTDTRSNIYNSQNNCKVNCKKPNKKEQQPWTHVNDVGNTHITRDVATGRFHLSYAVVQSDKVLLFQLTNRQCPIQFLCHNQIT